MKNLIVAHRGNTAEFPENTIAGVLSALKIGITHVEIDIQFSSDGIPFVIHDRNLLRTYGINCDVTETSSHQLISHGVPHLEMMILVVNQFVIEWGRPITLFVEIKDESFEDKTRGAAQLEALVDATHDWHRETKIVIIGFNLDLVERYYDLQQEIGNEFRINQIGWVVSTLDGETINQLMRSRCKYAFIDTNLLTGDVTLPKDVVWVAYEVSEVKQINNLLSRGVNLLETYQVRKMIS